MKAYHLFRKEQQEGPFTLEELKSLAIQSEDKVWYEGLDTWVNVSEVPELKPLIKAVPPPPPPVLSVAGPSIPAGGIVVPPVPKTQSRISFWLMLVGIFVVIVILLLYHSQQRKSEELQASQQQHAQLALASQQQQEELLRETQAQAALALDRQNIRRQVKADIQGYQADKVFGGIRDIKVLLFNNSNYGLDAVEVRVDYIRRGGGIFKSEYVYFRNIGPQSTVNLQAPDSELGIRASCEIIQIKSAQLGL